MTAKSSTSGRSSRVRTKSPSLRGWIDFGVFVLSALLITMFLQLTLPKFDKITYRFGDAPEQTTRLPLLVDTAAPTLQVKVPLWISSLSPRNFLVKPDDCIEELRINNFTVPYEVAKFCDYDEGRVLDLRKYLKNGNNLLEFKIRDDGGKGGINVTVANNDPLQIAAFSAFVLLFLWYALALVGHLRIKPENRLLAAVFVGGLMLRVMYVIATPFRVRSYDVGGHIEYVDFILKEWAIPLASNGWEYHQPPIYYWMSALWIHLNGFIGRAGDMLYNDLQTFSLLLSVGTLFVCAWIGRLLFPAKTGRKGDVLFLMLMAVMPGLVMFSSRFTNETLYHFLTFAGFGFILAWWKNGRMKDWYAALLLVIAASLSKISAAALFPVGLICFLVWKRMGWKPKLVHLGVSMLIIAALFVWYPIKRFTERNIANVVTLGNKNMNPDLSVPREVTDFLTFNPVEVMRFPYNDTWSDKYRRRYFWEFFFKSSFFGEFRFEKIKQLGSVIVALGMVLLPMLLLGLVATVRNRKNIYESLPMTLTTGALMAAALAYPTLFAYAPNQDFRFSILLCVPFGYYVVRGLLALPVVIRQIYLGALFAFVGSCSLFFLALYLRLQA